MLGLVRVASYIGLFTMIALGVGAFAWTDSWLWRALIIAAALAVGWYSLGLFARASTASAYRVMRGIGTDEDYEELDRLGVRQRALALQGAVTASDPQRDGIYRRMVTMLGGEEVARQTVIEHMSGHGIDVGPAEASALLKRWHLVGIVQDLSLGEFLDETAAEHPARPLLESAP
jgi:hypothetical protein